MGIIQSKGLPPCTERLHDWLNKNKIGITKCSKDIGMSPSTLSRMFSRKRPLKIIVAKALEQEYGVNSEWLLFGSEPEMKTWDEGHRLCIMLLTMLLDGLELDAMSEMVVYKDRYLLKTKRGILRDYCQFGLTFEYQAGNFNYYQLGPTLTVAACNITQMIKTYWQKNPKTRTPPKKRTSEVSWLDWKKIIKESEQHK